MSTDYPEERVPLLSDYKDSVLIEREQCDRDCKLHGTREARNDKGVRTSPEHCVRPDLHGILEQWHVRDVHVALEYYDRNLLHGTREWWTTKGDALIIGRTETFF